MSEKEKVLESAIAHIEKSFGKGAIMRLGEHSVENIPVISTGNLALDIALGVGGLPRGRIIEVYGPESSGKTTLCLHVIAEAQKTGGTVAFIDAEHALDAKYAKKLGVDIEKLLISQPDYGEQALDITDILVRSQAVDLIVVDSVAALTPKAEIEGDMGDSHMGLQARLMSQALRKLTASISKSHSMVIFVNQLRQKIGIVFGNPETTTGGNALKFYSSIRLDIRKINTLKTGEEFSGNRVRVKVVKNKMAPPFMEAQFDLDFGEGFSQVGTLLDLATDENLIQKSGSWYSYNEDKLGQGRDSAKQYLKDNPILCAKLDKIIREKHNLGVTQSIVKVEAETKNSKKSKSKTESMEKNEQSDVEQ